VIRVIGDPGARGRAADRGDDGDRAAAREMLEYGCGSSAVAGDLGVDGAAAVPRRARLIVGPIRRVSPHVRLCRGARGRAAHHHPIASVRELREAEGAGQPADRADRRAAPEGAAGAAGRRGGADQPRPAQHPDHRRCWPTGWSERRPRVPAPRPSWWARCRARSTCAKARWPSARPRSRRPAEPFACARWCRMWSRSERWPPARQRGRVPDRCARDR
jgi:hypothetical protein